ncbi:SDR family oxidoreductase [Curtobacterium sp. 1544]|uniref:SDR family oxidoreductase n=1 Tax=Curtobacterium sp. 1544 TaxID=3156417 RepID=UPI0033986F31
MSGRPVALVTGASRGIGLAIARDLARTHTVIAGARSAVALTVLLDEWPEVVPFVCDVGDADSVAAAVRDLGVDRLDVVVHSAGIADERAFDTFTRDDWRRSFEVNVFGVADLTARLLPALRVARGTIVFLNSGSGMFSYPDGAVYSGTKFALRTMADCLREEERERGVRVVSLHPGFVDTDMARTIRQASGREGPDESYVRPETIASAVRVAVDAPHEAQFETISVRATLRAEATGSVPGASGIVGRHG